MKRVDAKGYLCPLPLLHLRRGLVSLAVGETIELFADDETTSKDVPFFCKQMGHYLLSVTEQKESSNTYWIFRIRKGV